MTDKGLISKIYNQLIQLNIEKTAQSKNEQNGLLSGSVVKNPPAVQEMVGDMGSILGLERCPGRGDGNPLQYLCLENPMDRGDW